MGRSELSSNQKNLKACSSSGIEFHSLGAAIANVPSPDALSLAFGVARRC